MNTDFKSWITGSIFIVIVATLLFFLQWLINGQIYVSWFEWYGIMMAVFSILGGISAYKSEKKSIK